MSPRSPAVERSGPQRARSRRWLAAGALLALAPKCMLCLLAYAGLGAALGGKELCGATANASWPWPTWLAALGLIVTTATFVSFSRCSARR